MSKRTLLLALIVLALVAGCTTESASPTPVPSPESLPTSASATATVAIATVAAATAAPAGETPISGSPAEPAACVLEPLDFPVVPAPPVTEADQTYGPPGAPITFIEYADFQ
jgi:nitrous oxide reductase accessory protein NosL